MTTGPAAIKVSLFARARSFPASIAASVGRRPAQPTIPVTTRSALPQAAAVLSPSAPAINKGYFNIFESSLRLFIRLVSSGKRDSSASETTSG